MVWRRLTSRWLAISLIAGLVLAPMAPSVGMKAAAAAGMSLMTTDMPCCPDGQIKDCRDCPLVALCMLKTAQAGPSPTASLPVRHAIRVTHSVRNDAPADGLDRPPPDQPPRHLI